MPKKKKAAKNDFYFFMEEQKAALRREGRSWTTMNELADICGHRWQRLGQKEKQRFKDKAHAWKREQTSDRARCLKDVEEEARAARQCHMDMIEDIDSIVSSSFKRGTLDKQKFYFIHFNQLCQTGDFKFLPCELSVCEFSLSYGVSRLLQAFVRPPSIPLGLGYAIQRQADKHGVNLDVTPMNTKAATSYSLIVRKLLAMISPDGQELPPLFTKDDDFKKVTQLLEDLLLWASAEEDLGLLKQKIKVYHIHELLFRLMREVQPKMLRFSEAAKLKLQSEVFFYSPNVSCEFHEKVDRPTQCSLFHVRNWGYIISDCCCAFFDVDMIPGKHAPIGVDTKNTLKSEDPVLVLVDSEKWFDEVDDDSDDDSVDDDRDSLDRLNEALKLCDLEEYEKPTTVMMQDCMVMQADEDFPPLTSPTPWSQRARTDTSIPADYTDTSSFPPLS